MTRCFTVKTALTDYFNGTICRNKLYELIEKGMIPHIRVGTRIILREDLLDQWMLQLLGSTIKVPKSMVQVANTVSFQK